MNCQSLNKGNYVSRKLKLWVISISLWLAMILLPSSLSLSVLDNELSSEELIIKNQFYTVR